MTKAATSAIVAARLFRLHNVRQGEEDHDDDDRSPLTMRIPAFAPISLSVLPVSRSGAARGILAGLNTLAALALLAASALLLTPTPAGAQGTAPVRVPAQAPLPTPSAAAAAETAERKVPGLRVNPDLTPPPPEVADSINGFFNELKTSNAEKGYDILLTNTRIKERKEQVQALVGRTAQALALYGRVLGAELYDNRKLGSRLIVLTYLSYSEIQPLRWRFVYYKPGTTWIMINLDCDDKLSSWYE